MRRIVLTEEQRRKSEEKISASTKAVDLVRRRTRSCPKCGTVFDRIFARRDGHKGRCSVACNPGGVPVFRKTVAERRRLKKDQRREQKRLNRKRELSNTNFYLSREWRELRFKVLRKYNFACLACGRSKQTHGVVIHVDHIKPRSKHPELQLDPNNLQLLCEDCNLGKCNYSDDDLRPS